jgi:uncharacterized membrane protein YkgB
MNSRRRGWSAPEAVSRSPSHSPPSRENRFTRWDEAISTWMNLYGRRILRYALAIIFIWFGALKPLDASPANDLVRRTIYWFPPEVFLPILGWWEVAIGVCFLFRPLLRIGLFLLFLQMPGTFLPLVILPERCFERFPFVLTMEGQYIVKNLVLIAAALVIGGTIHPAPPHRKPAPKV